MQTTQPFLAPQSSMGPVPPRLLFKLGNGDVFCLSVIYCTILLVFAFSCSLLDRILYSVLFYPLQHCTAEAALLYWHNVSCMRVLYDELCDYLCDCWHLEYTHFSNSFGHRLLCVLCSNMSRFLMMTVCDEFFPIRSSAECIVICSRRVWISGLLLGVICSAIIGSIVPYQYL